MLPPDAQLPISRYLRVVDRLLPGRVTSFYVVGSTALGAYRPGRSDLDFFAVVDGDLSPEELRRLRLTHVAAGAGSVARAIARRRFMVPGTCNGVYLRAGDLGLPVSQVVPVASHVGQVFSVGSGFDVNPVGWHVLARHGIAVRGPEPSALGLRAEPEALRAWNLANLDAYWAPWARSVIARDPALLRPRWRWLAAWGVLGVARMHHTVATGEVISKEAAGEYALTAFDPHWHPVIHEALAYRLDREALGPAVEGAARAREAAGFALDTIRHAHALPA